MNVKGRSSMPAKQGWFNHAYRRNVIDMHIPSWNDAFLTQFDADEYVRMLEKIGAQSAVVYTQSHTGICNYPTRSGEFHRGFGGRDMFREVSERCRAKGIKVVAYYSLIFNNWAVEHHPEWGMVFVDGAPSHTGARGIQGNTNLSGGRYKHACVNNEAYRAFVRQQIHEITSYDIDGTRYDMTFWPCVCYCDACRARYKKETGRDRMPEIVDWSDPIWVDFQNRREAWLMDFAKMVTDETRKCKPDISVEHQIGPLIHSWRFGVPAEIRDYVDFMQADFYGDELQAMFVNKFLYNITPNPMFGFETSSSLDLNDHTSIKPKALLKTKLCVSMANGGAFVFIDAIDPVGTIHEKVYDVMEGVFKETSVYDRYRGGRMVQDVGVYFSTNSKMDFAQNGRHVRDYSFGSLAESMPHMKSVLGAVKALSSGHIPFGVISQAQLGELSRFKAIVLPNVLVMTDEEAGVFRRYVAEGGVLYADKGASLSMKDGRKMEDFALSDVFGVHFAGVTDSDFTYIAPTEAANAAGLLDGVSEKYPLSIRSAQTLVRAEEGTQVLAATVLPYTNTHDSTIFGSIHSHPPGILTGQAALVVNRYGKGKAVYSTADLETYEYAAGHFNGLIKWAIGTPLSFVSSAHPALDITVFENDIRGQYTMNLVSFQKTMPNLPIRNVEVGFFVGGRAVSGVELLPEQQALAYRIEAGYATIVIPEIDTFGMVRIQLQ